MLSFDVVQFFLSVNHKLLVWILHKGGFNTKLYNSVSSYFGPCSSSFVFCNETSPTFKSPSVGVRQGSSLSPMFLAIYLSLAIHALHSTSSISVTFGLQFYVNNGSLTTSSTDTQTTCHILCIAYHMLECQLMRLGLVIEHDEGKLIHFPLPNTKPHMPHDFDHIPLDLWAGPWTHDHPIPSSKTIQHLGFLLNSKLSFKDHVKFYTKGNVTMLAYRMLGTSIHGLTPYYCRMLYKSCILPILMYRAPAWYRLTGSKFLLNPLHTTQNMALHWIMGTFSTTPVNLLLISAAIKHIALYCQKLHEQYLLWIYRLMESHPIKAVMISTLHTSDIPFSTSIYLAQTGHAVITNHPITNHHKVFYDITTLQITCDYKCHGLTE